MTKVPDGMEIHTGHPDVRLLKLPGSPPDYDPVAKTLFGLPVTVGDFDTASFDHYDTRVVIVDAMQKIESRNDKVVGFQQYERCLLVVGEGRDGHACFLDVCWECKWLHKAHQPECPWKLVLDVSRR